MADVLTFDCNQLNFFKISAVVVEEFPIALRRVFAYMWNNLACHLPGFQPWDDSLAVRTIFLYWEGGTTKVPCNKSFKEWDCTALFQATLFANCFGVLSSRGTHHTLHEEYVKPCGLTRGTFHPSVLSPTGKRKETFALALNQLRLLRNILSHQTSTRCIDRATFDDYMRMVKDAFTALGQATSGVEDIKNLEEKDFPTERSRQLERELIAVLQGDRRECCKDAPASCVPDAIPHFIGRQEECDTILRHLTAEETRLVNAWGPPGFGKTSVATKVARELHEMRRLVYFIPVKGMTTKDELISKLLSIFSEACKQVPHIAPSDKLIQSLRQLTNPSVLILDNVDGLVESRESKVKEDMLRFTEEVLHQCNAVKLLYTTRESMDYLSHKVSIHLQKIGVLDEVSSIRLVKSMLPGAPSEVHCCTVAETCGRVPLAMRLMCSIVKDEMISVEDLLEELECSPLVNVLDNPRLPNDARLKALINSSFQRLTEDERKAFVCLAVFPGCFKEQAATLVLESESASKTKRIIHVLERKSLIESSKNFESFTIHSLLQSFIDDKRKNDNKINALFREARARFYQFYIAVFQSANRKFLNGHSFEALKEFIAERENIVSSLLGCVDVKALFYDAVTVLSEAEMFLYAVLTNEPDLFEKIYTKAMRETQETQDSRCESQLRAAKAFAQVGWFLSKRSMVEDSLLADKTDGVGFSPKQMCYIGFYCLLAGKHEEGMTSLTRAVEGLGSRCDEVVLKVLTCHVLAVCYRRRKNEKMASHFKSLSVRECLSRESPFALRFLFSNSEQDSNSAIEDDFILGHLMAELLSSIYTECANYNEIQDLTYGLERFHRTLIALTEKVRGEHVDTAQVYYELGLAKYDLGDLRGSLEFNRKALSIRQQLLGDDHTDTAASFNQIGCVYLKMGDHGSAIESFERALELNVRLRGDHVDTAQTYHHLGVAKCDFGDLTGSIDSLRQALNLRRKLLGDHTDTAVSYDQLGCVYRKVGNLHAASNAFHSAANMRTKLLGDHIDAAESFFDLGLTRFRMEDYQGALEAHEQAARLRQQLLRDHPDTAASFEHLGLTYHALGDKESSLQSLLCALDMRTKLLTVCRGSKYADDNEWWVNKYRDALASQQETLKIILEWSGQQSHIAVELIETGLAYLDAGEMEASQEAFERAWTEAKLLLSIDEEPSNNCTIKKLQHCCLL